MIVTFGSTKGGVGKTTLAVNFALTLAEYGQTVMLVDGDEQGHAWAFTALHRMTHQADNGNAEPRYEFLAVRGPELRSKVTRIADDFDQVVIDVGGRDTATFRAALSISDLLIIPTPPRSFDVWATEATAIIATQIQKVNPKLRILAVLNAADPLGNDNQDAKKALRKFEGLEVSRHQIVRRKAFPNATAAGQSILELGTGKAQDEFTSFFKSIFPTLKARA